MKNIPNKIYLKQNPGNQSPDSLTNTVNSDWHTDKMNDDDLVFVHFPVLQNYIKSRIDTIKSRKMETDPDEEFAYSLFSKEKLDELKMFQKFLEDLK